jgi:hypothetical protein
VAQAQYRNNPKRFQKGMTQLGIPMDSVIRTVRGLEVGYLEGADNPHFVSFLALSEWYAANPKGQPTRVQLEPLREAIRAGHGLNLNDTVTALQPQAARILKTERSTHTKEALNFLRRGLQVGKEGSLQERKGGIDAWMAEFATRKQAIEDAIEALFGKPYSVTVARHPDLGHPLIVVDLPESDVARIKASYSNKFSEALDAMERGDLTYGQAYAESIPHVAEAHRARERVKELLATQEILGETARQQARAENMLQYFTDVMEWTHDAIARGNKNKLQKLVMTRVRSGPNKGHYVPTKQYQELLELLEGSPPQHEFVRWFVNSGLVASLESFDDLAYKSWWHRQRNQTAQLGWSMEQQVSLFNRLSDEILGQQLAQFTDEDMAATLMLFREMSTLSDSAIASGRVGAGVESTGASVPFLSAEGGDRLVYTADTIAGRGGEAPMSAAAAGDYALDQMDAIRNLLDVGRQGTGQAKVLAALEEAGTIRRGTQSELDRHRNRLAVARRQARIETAPQGYSKAKEFGLDEGLLSKFGVKEEFVPFWEATINNSRLLYSPYFQVEASRFLKRLFDLWKAGATVARPSFHIRNMIGGVYNGLIAGTGPSHYWNTWGDVNKFRKLLARYADEGVADMGVDVFEDLIISQLDPSNQAVFREAWRTGTLQTSFSRAESLYEVGSSFSFKPWETNFAPFKVGGQWMEFTEDHLRIATFKANFDNGAADLIAEGRKAHSITNAVHFDYTDLTALEQSIKKIMPFYVWSRRNIPLQLRTLVQNPVYMLSYEKARANWNEQELASMETIDPFTRYASSKGWLLPYGRDDGEAFSHMIWNPQLPVFDLDALPWNDTKIPTLSPNPIRWFGILMDGLGPGLSVPQQLYQDQQDGGHTNAPAGLNAVFAALDSIGVPLPGVEGPYPDPTSGIAPDVDYRIPKTAKGVFNFLVPYYDDYRAMLGIRPNNPYIASGEGWLPGDDPGALNSAPLRFQLGPLGRTFGRGIGLQNVTSSSTYFEQEDIDDYLRSLRTDARYRMGATQSP